MPCPRALPPLFLDRLGAIVPADRLPSVTASFSAPRWGSFRVNRLLADVEPVLAGLALDGIDAARVPFCAEGFVVPPAARDRLGASGAAAGFRIWLQNPSSMIPPLALAPEPGERVLDLAAAPGSKTLQLAAMVGSGGELAAVESVRARFFRLRRNLDAAGAGFVRTYLQDGTRAWRYRPDHFDRVLLDAPCSTEGRFRTDEPRTFSYWSEAKIREMARKQKRLLESAVRCARPGGVVVYSTCSFAPEENEAVVSHVLSRHDLEVEPLPFEVPDESPGLPGWDGVAFDPRMRHVLRVLPDGVYEAFFVARLRKRS